MIRNLQRKLFKLPIYRCPLSKYEKICQDTKKVTKDVDAKNDKE